MDIGTFTYPHTPCPDDMRKAWVIQHTTILSCEWKRSASFPDIYNYETAKEILHYAVVLQPNLPIEYRALNVYTQQIVHPS